MENLNLIKKIASVTSKKTGIEFDDLYSEACLAYLESISKFDPKRGKISTFMWTNIHNHLGNYIAKNYERQPQTLSFEDVKIERSDLSSLFFEYLSTEAQQMAEIVLKTPTPFVTAEPEHAINRLCSIMKKQGWGMKRCLTGIRDLQRAFS